MNQNKSERQFNNQFYKCYYTSLSIKSYIHNLSSTITFTFIFFYKLMFVAPHHFQASFFLHSLYFLKRLLKVVVPTLVRGLHNFCHSNDTQLFFFFGVASKNISTQMISKKIFFFAPTNLSSSLLTFLHFITNLLYFINIVFHPTKTQKIIISN